MSGTLTERERGDGLSPVGRRVLDLTGATIGNLTVTGLVKLVHCPVTHRRIGLWHAVREGGGNVFSTHRELLRLGSVTA